MKNKILICIISVIIFSIICIGAYFGISSYEEKKEQEYVRSYIDIINNDYTNFKLEENRTEKLNLLKLMIREFEVYKQYDEIHDEIFSELELKINEMKNYFISNYNDEINNNSFDNLEEIKDKKVLNGYINNLSKLLETIKNEKDIVLTQEEFLEYENKIIDLINSYNAKIEKIEEIEKNKELENNSKNQNLNKNQSSNKNNSNSANNKNSNNQLHSIWWENENGRTEGYADGYGHIYDENGNDVTW